MRNDDIVTRLREWDADPATDMKDCPFCDGVRWRGHLDHCVLKQAADEIERLRNALAEQTIIHEVQKTNTLSEIVRLRRCLQHAIDHVGKWGLFTAEEKQAVLTEYEQAVQGG